MVCDVVLMWMQTAWLVLNQPRFETLYEQS
jgi:hypothetical protein